MHNISTHFQVLGAGPVAVQKGELRNLLYIVAPNEKFMKSGRVGIHIGVKLFLIAYVNSTDVCYVEEAGETFHVNQKNKNFCLCSSCELCRLGS